MTLSYVSNDELLQELASRFDHMIFIGLIRWDEKKSTEKLIRRWKGNTHTCIGLAHDIQHRMMMDFEERYPSS